MKSQKHLFNLKEDIHYLNCGYKAPLLKSAEEAAIKALIKSRNPSDVKPTDFFSETEEVKELFAKIVNCAKVNVAIIPSTSYGLGSIINNVKCKPGQHAITVENEFPSAYFALKKWCDGNGAPLKIIKPLIGADCNEILIDSITNKTALVIISSIHWMNGLKFDLEKIGNKCQNVGAKFIVDGTQSVGALPMDVQQCKIDALICAGYKWLFGPYSLGLAYIGEAFHNGSPIEESWMNRENAEDFSSLTNYNPHYKPNAGRYNVGETSNFILMPMLKEALKQINLWSAQNIQSYCEELTTPLFNYLNHLGVESSQRTTKHLFGLKLPQNIDMEIFKDNLTKNNVYLSVRGSSLRVSVNVFNTSEDIKKLIEVIEQTISSS